MNNNDGCFAFTWGSWLAVVLHMLRLSHGSLRQWIEWSHAYLHLCFTWFSSADTADRGFRTVALYFPLGQLYEYKYVALHLVLSLITCHVTPVMSFLYTVSTHLSQPIAVVVQHKLMITLIKTINIKWSHPLMLQSSFKCWHAEVDALVTALSHICTAFMTKLCSLLSRLVSLQCDSGVQRLQTVTLRLCMSSAEWCWVL